MLSLLGHMICLVQLAVQVILRMSWSKNPFKKLLKVVQTKNSSMGYHIVEPNIESAKLKIKEGFNFIAFGTDFYFMSDNAIKSMKSIRNEESD